jgi:uncharacterized lipoprotein NlpE involved in copper resistance
MLKSIISAAILFVCVTGCGGGSSSSGQVSFSGDWLVEVPVTQAGCSVGVELDDPLVTILSVDEQGSEIATRDSRGTLSSGKRDSSISFTVVGDANLSGSDCKGVSTTKFFDADESYAKVSVVWEINCGDAFKCTRKYEGGTAIRK